MALPPGATFRVSTKKIFFDIVNGAPTNLRAVLPHTSGGVLDGLPEQIVETKEPPIAGGSHDVAIFAPVGFPASGSVIVVVRSVKRAAFFNTRMGDPDPDLDAKLKEAGVGETVERVVSLTIGAAPVSISLPAERYKFVDLADGGTAVVRPEGVIASVRIFPGRWPPLTPSTLPNGSDYAVMIAATAPVG